MVPASMSAHPRVMARAEMIEVLDQLIDGVTNGDD
jgi:hypothetical protein